MTDFSRTAVCEARFGELSTTQLYGLLKLRVEVFVVEQSCPYAELDGRDTEPGTVHLWTADDSGAATAYLRLLTEADGSGRIGRVCTRADSRGAGHAARLVQQAVERLGGRHAVLDAQAHLQAWYERLGFVVCGPEFLDDDIPHVPMELSPAPQPSR